jgi:hypothetical protein
MAFLVYIYSLYSWVDDYGKGMSLVSVLSGFIACGGEKNTDGKVNASSGVWQSWPEAEHELVE